MLVGLDEDLDPDADGSFLNLTSLIDLRSELVLDNLLAIEGLDI